MNAPSHGQPSPAALRPGKHVLILGATGSIGLQALEVLSAMPQHSVVGLACGSNGEALAEQALRHGVRRIAIADDAAARAVAARWSELDVVSGEAGVVELVGRAAADAKAAGVTLTVLNGIVGAAGLGATMAALEVGVELALANKESMVAGGPFVLAAARRSGATIIPVDSEHSALFQCLAAGGEGAADAPEGPAAVAELLLTGSGGPFRGRKAADLAAVTRGQALKHPNWSMGPKVTIDSATLMNKGLELIEAHYLFDVPFERITVVINPQSIVHSMVRYADGAILAHLGVPDMRTPIGYALAYPERPSLPMVGRLDLLSAGLTFEAPDPVVFRCLALAREAGERAAAAELRAGDDWPRTVAAPIVLNAANEVAVEAFLGENLSFVGIADVVEACLERLGDTPITSVEDIHACDAEARREARGVLRRRSAAAGGSGTP